MLMLTRRVGEAIYIDVEGGIRVSVAEVRGKQVRLGVECSHDIAVVRSELLERQRVQQPQRTIVRTVRRKYFGLVEGKIQSISMPRVESPHNLLARHEHT